MELTGKTTEAGCPIPCSILSAASRLWPWFWPYSLFRCSTADFQETALAVIVQMRENDPVNLFHDPAAAKGILALTWPKAKVIGVDYWGAVYNYSKAICEKNAASEGVASRCVFQHGDAKHLDFPDESFDVVISNYVYHNVMGADMQKLLLESLRVLKKGGVFALNDDMKPKMYGDMEDFAQKLRDMGYQDVRLIDTAQEAFGSHRRAAMMMLGSSRLLVGRK